jgi:aminoglycoside 2''-phosphotransferase
MNKQVLLRKIKREFPELQWKTAKHNVEGWDHYVLILDGEYVFRFPRKPVYKKRLYQEAMLLQYLAPLINIPVPQYEFISKDKTFAGYVLIPGIPLTPKVFKIISKPARTKIAKQLAEFFSVLHKTPLKIAKKFEKDDANNLKLYKDLVKNCNKYLKPRLSKNNFNLVEDFLTEFGKNLSHPHKCLVHADIKQEHLLITKNKQNLAGVIDFADRAIGDPALDFAELWLYGKEFVEEVYKYYTGPKDKDFLYRSTLYCKRAPLWIMNTPFLGMRGKFSKGYELFKKVYLKNIFLYKNSEMVS